MNIFNNPNSNISSKYRYFKIIFLYSNLFVFKILGLLPWKINFSLLKISSNLNLNQRINNSTKKIMSVSIWGLIYSVILMIFNLLSSIYAFDFIVEINKSSRMSIVIQAVHVGIAIFEVFSVTCVWMLYILHKRTIFDMSEKLIEIGRTLNSSIKYNWQITPRIVFIVLINMGVSITLVVTEFMLVDFMSTFTWCISVLATAWMFIQYALILEVINHQLKMINREILNLGNISENIKIRNIFIIKLPMRSYSECHIVNLKYAYANLCKIFDRLSYFYAIPVLLCVIFFGTIITFTAYFDFYKFYVINDTSGALRQVIKDCMWLIVIASAIITLITTVNNVKKEISVIPDHIHWLLNSCSTSGDMENALIEFSNDLLSRKINFTAYGIIPLDGSLLFSVLGSSITYLVILIQFQLK